MSIYPSKLNRGDEIRVLAPSDSMSSVSKEHITEARASLEGLGFRVSFGKRSFEKNDFNSSSSIEARVKDLHDAFKDKDVKMILPIIGGYHSNQLLSYLDYDLISRNPKLLGGYSDTTALQNAIFAKTGIVTYSCIAFIMMAKVRNNDYSFESFLQCFTSDNQYKLLAPKYWDDSQWYLDQQNYELFTDTELKVINNGSGAGKIIGGNLSSLRLLQGTEYFPGQDEDYILFLEECEPSKGADFDREFQSLLHFLKLKHLKGIVIGRFQMGSQVDYKALTDIFSQYKEINEIPIIVNAPFGHTYPISAFPIGGLASIETNPASITIIKH